MAYVVELTRRAERVLVALYEFICAEDSAVARRWFNGLEKAIQKLEQLPRRCPIAPESQIADRQLRHVLYGTKPNIYRVIYKIDESRQTVRVLTVQHRARDLLIARDRVGKEC
jgi:plasmid stabilization system protein ParE